MFLGALCVRLENYVDILTWMDLDFRFCFVTTL